MKRLLVLVLLSAGCATATPVFEDRLLDTLPEGCGARSFRFTRDGTVVAYVRYRSGQLDRDEAVVNRIAGKPLSLV